MNPGSQEQGRIEQNVKRTVGKRALKEIRGIVNEERRMEASNERFLRAFIKYGWIIMLLAALLLAKLLGVY
jgi:cation transport ATPase